MYVIPVLNNIELTTPICSGRVSASADGSSIAVADLLSTVSFHELDKIVPDKPLHIIPHDGIHRVFPLRLIHDGRAFLTGTQAGKLQLWDSATAELLDTLHAASTLALDDVAL